MLSVDEVKHGDRVKDINGKVYKVVSVEKNGTLKLTAKGITSKSNVDAVATLPSSSLTNS